MRVLHESLNHQPDGGSHVSSRANDPDTCDLHARPVRDGSAAHDEGKENPPPAGGGQHGKLVGIVSDKDLLYASPSPVSSLSVWEMNYLLAKLKVEEVMTHKVLTVTEDTPLEEAARIMADNKIGGLP